MQAARTPVVLGDRRKEGLEQPCDVPAFGTRRALLLMPHSSPVIGYERVVKDAACWVSARHWLGPIRRPPFCRLKKSVVFEVSMVQNRQV